MQQFAGNLLARLTQQGVPELVGTALANKLAAAGAQAGQGQTHLTVPHLLSQAALHQAIGQTFVDALHGSFLLSGAALLAIALLVAFLLKSSAARVSRKLADQPQSVAVEREERGTPGVSERLVREG